MKSIGRKITSGLIITLLILTSVIPAFAAEASLADTFTEEVFALDNPDMFVDMLDLFSSISAGAQDELVTTYGDAFGALANAQQDRVNSFGVTMDAVDAFVDFCSDEDYDINNLTSYIDDNDKVSFKNAIERRQAEFEATLGAVSDVTTLKSGFAKMDKLFDFIALSKFTTGLVDIFDASNQYGDLTLNETKAETLIDAANDVLGNEIDGVDYVVNAIDEFVTFYNDSSSADQELIYDYFDNYGMINLQTTTGGSSGGGPVEPVDDDTSEADQVSDNADSAETEDDASSVVNESSEAAENTNEAAQTAETDDEKQAVSDDTQKILDSVAKVTSLITSSEGAKEASAQISKTLSSVGKIIESLNDEKSSQDLADKAGETVDKASDLLDKVDNIDDKITMAKGLITGIKDIKNAAKDAGQAIEKKAVDVVNKAVESAGKTKADDVTELAGKATAKINKDSFTTAIENVKKVKDTLEGELVSNGIESNKKVKTKVTIEVSSTEEINEVETELPALRGVFEEVDNVEIKSEVADFGIGKDTLPEDVKDGDFKLSAKSVSDEAIRSKLPAGTPANAPVIDLNISVKKGDVDEKISKFNKPIEVSVKVQVDNPQDGEYVSVFLLKDDGTIEKIGGKYDAKTGKIKFKTNHFSIYFAKVDKESFNDIGNFDWAQKGITVLASKGIINGKGEGSFDPENTVTRAEFVSMIVRMLKIDSDEAVTFSDVSEDVWYAQSVAAATNAGIINGRTSDTFAPNETITRQEISKIVAKVLESENYNIPVNMSKISKLEDNDQIADWAKEYVELAYREGIINGRTKTTFVPEANATRAEAAVMIHRLFNLI